MAYCTLDDMTKKIPENILINLSNDSPGATVVDNANIAEAIEAADNEIDTYVGLIQTTPVVPFAVDIRIMPARHMSRLIRYGSPGWVRLNDPPRERGLCVAPDPPSSPLRTIGTAVGVVSLCGTAARY